VSEATAIVLDEGVEALSIKRVAEAVDYTPGALYRYFPSKDALLAAVVVGVLEDLELHLRAADVREEPLERILAQVHAYRRYSTDSPGAFALLTRMAAEPRVLLEEHQDAGEVMEAMVSALAPLGDALETAAREGALEPGPMVERGLLLFSSLQGTLQLRKQRRMLPLIDADHLALEVVRVLLRGWGAARDAIADALVALEESEEEDSQLKASEASRHRKARNAIGETAVRIHSGKVGGWDSPPETSQLKASEASHREETAVRAVGGWDDPPETEEGEE